MALVEILLPISNGYDVRLVEAEHTVNVQLEIFRYMYMYTKVFPYHRPPACPFQFYPLSPAQETPVNHFLITF